MPEQRWKDTLTKTCKTCAGRPPTDHNGKEG